jgi:3'(2'), 5'-bisphosphate nucleotidase
MDYEKLATAMRRLALEAGAAVMDIYGQDDFAVRAKDDKSPVTVADETADAIIARGLRAEFPDVPLVTEEQAESHRSAGLRFLIVDPLDGTKEFIQRRGDFTINIALVEGGTPVRGVVYAPAKNRLFLTDAAGRSFEEIGAHDVAHPGAMVRLKVRTPDNSALNVVASKSHRDAATDAYIGRYRTADFLAAGSSMKFCLVATGEADLYPRLGRTMEWDTAAGQAVLAGAGGRVTLMDGKNPLTYGKPGYENPHFLAFAPGVEIKD